MIIKNRPGWITVACAFVLQGLSHGLGSSMGVFYIQWGNTFPSSSTMISALASSVLATILCTAPIAGAISRKAGIRLAMATGGALAFGGFICTSFVQQASYLFITVAFMIGFGSSVVYMASVIAVSNHFKKNFATAAGIANAGASVGVLVLPLLFEILVTAYGWRGACLIVASIQLHVFVCLMIIKVPQRFEQGPSEVDSSREPLHASHKDKIHPSPKLYLSKRNSIPHISSEALRETGSISKLPKSNFEEVEIVSREKYTKKDQALVSDDVGEDIALNPVSKRFIPVEAARTADADLIDSNASKHDGDDIIIDPETGGNGGPVNRRSPKDDSPSQRNSGRHLSTVDSGKADITEQSPGTVTGEAKKARPQSDRTFKPPVHAGDSLASTDGGDLHPDREGHRSAWCQPLVSWLHSFLSLFNVQLLWTNLPFSCLVVPFSLGGWFWGTILPHLAARAVTVGIDQLLASSLISVIGAGNIISRIFCGRLVDSGLVHPMHLYGLSHACTAAASLVIALSGTYPLLCIGAFGVGIGSGIYIPLMQPIVRSLVGPEDFAGGFGLCLLSVGIGNYMSATSAGLIYEVSQNYTYVFLLPTCLAVLSTCLLVANHLYWGVYRRHPNWPKRTERVPQGQEESALDTLKGGRPTSIAESIPEDK